MAENQVFEEETKLPFTVSHIAAVLPLRLLPLSFPGLVIGAMSPDFTYVVQVFWPTLEAHSIQGILYFCLPVSCLVLLAYQTFLRQAWEKLLPWLKGPSRPYRWYAIPLSILIGASTHVVWDSFTHQHGYSVIHVSLLRVKIFEIGSYSLTVFKVLQHVSSVAGGCAVGLAIYRATKHSKDRKFVASQGALIALLALTFFVTFIFSVTFVLTRMNKLQSVPELLVAGIFFRLLAALVAVVFIYPFFILIRSKIQGK